MNKVMSLQCHLLIWYWLYRLHRLVYGERPSRLYSLLHRQRCSRLNNTIADVIAGFSEARGAEGQQHLGSQGVLRGDRLCAPAHAACL